jgi:DNA repair ATPase RecN
MKILSLTAENIKRLRVVEITPDGSVVQVTGANGSGKSSLLDAIYWALNGERGVDPQPVRRGEKKARVRLDLGDVIVTRRFTESGTSLIVEAQNGARFPSPQRMLDELLGALTFDPLEFARMDARQQAETLRKLVGIDFKAIDDKATGAFTKRTDVNRKVRSLTERVDALLGEIDAGMDVTPIDVDALVTKMAGTVRHNAAIERERVDRARELEFVDSQRKHIADIDEQIARLQEQRANNVRILEEADRRISAWEPLAEMDDTADLQQQIQDAQQLNRQREQQAQVRETRRRVVNELQAARSEAENLTAELEEYQAEKRGLVSAVAFPVEGLSLSESGAVVYNGIPFEQASSAEQLRVSVALAMAANPKLRILRVKDGSLLDETSLGMIGEMADAQDYQIWIERVETSGKVGIHMVDGSVASINGEPVPSPSETEPATAGA